jgi:predicted enzyme related to lactoylglutathione lyase
MQRADTRYYLPMRRMLLAFFAVSTLYAQKPTGIGNFIHVVADLDKTMAFYGDTLGLERTGAPGPRDFTPNEFLERLYDAKGAQSRVAVFKIPSATMGLEFVQFKGIPQTPFRPKVDEAGASIVQLARADRTGTIQDPDGFYIRFVKPGDGVQPAELVLVSRDPHGVFGDLKGFHVSLVDPKERPAVAPALHDPGAGVLRLVVADVDATLASIQSEGIPVASANGEVAVTNNRRYVILRNPDGLFFQLFPAPK